MDTLTRISAQIAQLFEDAAASDTLLRQQMATYSDADKAAMRGNGHRAFYAKAKEFHLAVSVHTANLLYMLVRATGARSIIEFGTSFGVSTLHLAAGLRDAGGGHIITTEFEPSKVARARQNVAVAMLSDLVEIREGDALETLASALPESVDLVLLDGAKPLYRGILAMLEPRLRVGAMVLADNADWSQEYLDYVRAPGGNFLSVPFSNEVELSVKL